MDKLLNFIIKCYTETSYIIQLLIYNFLASEAETFSLTNFKWSVESYLQKCFTHIGMRNPVSQTYGCISNLFQRPELAFYFKK